MDALVNETDVSCVEHLALSSAFLRGCITGLKDILEADEYIIDTETED